MATSFIKSFMEAVNPAAARAAKRSQDPQDPRVERERQPQAASNALLDATAIEALEERPAGPEIVVIPLTEELGSMSNINTVEISGRPSRPRGITTTCCCTETCSHRIRWGKHHWYRCPYHHRWNGLQNRRHRRWCQTFSRCCYRVSARLSVTW